ncbi:hypothetical protein GLW08_13920 [Pontibacillus yanchengensis]|uniref:Uncharacterized protein n=1 Tax=Pontibacillus yanchengensis TaxID=462910 RepID=A0ACC7VIA4_9BACI|nr:hypothetical protein [Pontibacillus yanchengensis]MYL54427.1 hypothetical protein [Pontibacillus yanchengensis]
MNQEQEHLYDYVIIAKDTCFYDIVSIKNLLQTFADIQAYMARYSNPLTGLPGKDIIEENLTETSILLQEILRNTSYDSFSGHIGGNDFIGAIYSHEYKSISEQIIQVFDQKVPSFYSVTDWDRGFVNMTEIIP